MSFTESLSRCLARATQCTRQDEIWSNPFFEPAESWIERMKYYEKIDPNYAPGLSRLQVKKDVSPSLTSTTVIGLTYKTLTPNQFKRVLECMGSSKTEADCLSCQKLIPDQKAEVEIFKAEFKKEGAPLQTDGKYK